MLARARNIFGPGKTAEMTYYRTRREAKVFAAGVLNFGARADRRVVDRMLVNLMTKLEDR